MLGWRRASFGSLFVFLAPFVVPFVLFQAFPLAIAALNSTMDYNLLRPDSAVGVGFGNYLRAWADPAFWNSVLVTTAFTAGQVLIAVPASLGLALLVQSQIVGHKWIRAAAFSPTVTSTVVISAMWLLMFSPIVGILNVLVRAVGLPGFDYLTSSTQALPSLVLMGIWQQVGFGMVLYLAGLQTIPTSLMEAAAIDGAGIWQRFRRVTLPLLSRTTLLVVIVTSIYSYQTFTPAYIMTKGGPEGTTDFFVYLIYRVAFQAGDMGYASALSVLFVGVLLALSVTQFRLLRTRWEY
jgi:multiple sugar transport system permease protein